MRVCDRLKMTKGDNKRFECKFEKNIDDLSEKNHEEVLGISFY